MTPTQIQLIQSSHQLLQPIAAPAAALFYNNLFRIDPTLRPLFQADLGDQGARLMAMIGSAVGLLGRPDALLPVLRKLGERHAGYGVQAAHYNSVGAALLQTLAQGLGDVFNPATQDAWATLYGLISQTMQQGAAAAPGAAPTLPLAA